MSSYDQLVTYTKQLERRLANMERQEQGVSVAGGDHGTLAGLGDDDHTGYLLASAATSRAAFATNWTDLTDGGATTLHKHDHGGQDGLADDDHTIYLLASAATNRATFATNWTDLTDAGATTLHKHDHGGQDGLADDDHSIYLLASAATSRAAFATNWTDLTDTGDTTLHTHDGRYFTETEINTTLSGYASLSAYNVFTNRMTISPPALSVGTWSYDIFGAAGAARDILRTGMNAFSNGFTVQYDGTIMKYVFNDGSVGIGTTSPQRRLHLSGDDVNDAVTLRIENANAAGSVKYGQLSQMGSTGYGISGWASAFVFEGQADGGLVLSSYGSYGAIRFQTQNRNERMVIAVDGKVGIGTGAPDGRLHVVQDGSVAGIRVTGGTNPLVLVIDGSLYMKMQGLSGTSGVVGTQSNHPLGIYTNNTSRLHVTADGKVAIGNSSPSAKLTVDQSDSGANIAVMDLIQTDLGEAFIDFRATGPSAGYPIDTAAVGTYYGKIRVATNGTYRYIPLYNT